MKKKRIFILVLVLVLTAPLFYPPATPIAEATPRRIIEYGPQHFWGPPGGGHDRIDFGFRLDEPAKVHIEIQFWQDWNLAIGPADCTQPGVCQVDEESIWTSPVGDGQISDGIKNPVTGILQLGPAELPAGDQWIHGRAMGAPGSHTVLIRITIDLLESTPTPSPTATAEPMQNFLYFPLVANNFCSPGPRSYAIILGTSGSQEFLLKGDGTMALDAEKAIAKRILSISPAGRDRILVIASGGTKWSHKVVAETGDPVIAIAASEALTITWQSSTLAPAFKTAIDAGVTDIVLVDDVSEYLDIPGREVEVQRAAQMGVKIHVVLTDVVDPNPQGAPPEYTFGQWAAAKTGGIYLQLDQLVQAEDFARQVAERIFCWSEVPGGQPPEDPAVGPFVVAEPPAPVTLPPGATGDGAP